MVEYMGCFFCTYCVTETEISVQITFNCDLTIKLKNAFSNRLGKEPRFCQKLGFTDKSQQSLVSRLRAFIKEMRACNYVSGI